MGFSYKPYDVTLVLIACTAMLAIIFRLRKGSLMSWPILFWMFVFWFHLMWGGPYETLYLCLAAGATLLVRFEFHNGAASKFLIFLEFIAYGWLIYTSMAEAFHWG